MLEEAKKYTCRKKFKIESSYCCRLASKIGMFDVFTEHMKRSINKKVCWNEELILEISKKYRTRSDFYNKEKSAYRASQRLGILNKVCSHMVKPEQHRYWTKERIFECAKKYNKKLYFQKENSGAYAAAINFKILDDVCNHMVDKNIRLGRDATGRVCKKCNIFKPKDSMSGSRKSKSGMSSICKDCKNKFSSIRIKKNPEKHNFYIAYRRATNKKAIPPWINSSHKNEMKKIYEESKMKSKSENIIYEVDHIIPLVSDFVCGLHVPWNLRVITRKENREKNNKIIDYV